MQTSSAVSTMQMTMNENPVTPDNRQLFRLSVCKSRETDWDRVIMKADKLIARAGAVAVALSALYFISIFIVKALS